MEKAVYGAMSAMGVMLLGLISYLGDKGVTAVETNTKAIIEMSVTVDRMENDRKEDSVNQREYRATTSDYLGKIQNKVNKIEVNQRVVSQSRSEGSMVSSFNRT